MCVIIVESTFTKKNIGTVVKAVTMTVVSSAIISLFSLKYQTIPSQYKTKKKSRIILSRSWSKIENT